MSSTFTSFPSCSYHDGPWITLEVIFPTSLEPWITREVMTFPPGGYVKAGWFDAGEARQEPDGEQLYALAAVKLVRSKQTALVWKLRGAATVLGTVCRFCSVYLLFPCYLVNNDSPVSTLVFSNHSGHLTLHFTAIPECCKTRASAPCFLENTPMSLSRLFLSTVFLLRGHLLYEPLNLLNSENSAFFTSNTSLNPIFSLSWCRLSSSLIRM